MTYMDLYISALEACIERGGKQEDVERAVTEYNAFNREAFEKWLASVPSVHCATCGDVFKPEGTKKAGDEILCAEHAS